MAEVINLKLHRKRKARTEKEAAAAANRAKFGRGKQERVLADAQAAKDAKHLDGHKIEE